ncbi:MAG TPA: hypothetical protein VKA14_09970, partial [Gammaproteobacteria bacterium]|nr:hypothetical protein [Gammaproteobacteria bacterium]
MSDWKEAIHRQRAQLARLLHEPLARLAERAAAAWGDRRQLNDALFSGFAELPHCTYLYVLDAERRQASDSVGRYGVVPGHWGADRSDRPYMQEAIPPWGFLLSDAYVSRHAGR